MNKSDFTAELKFQTTEKGGRKNYVKSGYRPHIEFENYPEYLTSGQQTYIGTDFVLPGETVNAKIGILGTEYFTKRLYENMEFKFCEGNRTIGFGKIIKIINTDLKCEPNIDQKTINLNLYPTDIIDKIKLDYKQSWNKAFLELQKLIISNKSFRNERIIRAIIHLGDKDLVHLDEIIEQTKIDWRDILFWAEYVMCATEENLKQKAYYGSTGTMQWSGPVGECKVENFVYDSEIASKLWTVSEQATDCEFVMV